MKNTPYTFHYDKQISLFLSEALSEDAFYQKLKEAIQKDGEDPKLGLLKYLDYSLHEAAIYGKLALDQNAVAIWSVPLGSDLSKQKKEAKENFLKNDLGQHSYEFYQNCCQFMDSQIKNLVSEKALYLSILGVCPTMQNQGIGTRLLTPFLEEASANQEVIYLETFHSRNEVFYERLGFHKVKEVPEPHVKHNYSLMLRS